MMIRVLILILGLVPSSAAALGLCVDQDYANLREGPGLNYPISLVVNKFTPLRSVGRQGRWIKVRDFEKRLHWVREDLVSENMRCAVVASEYANLRRGPGLHFPKKVPYRADRYIGFRVLDRRAEWVRLEDIQGDIVWAHSPLLWIP